jgi:hypothetical protein
MWRLNFVVKSIFQLQRLELMQKAYGDAALNRTTIFEWHKRFREGRVSEGQRTQWSGHNKSNR